MITDRKMLADVVGEAIGRLTVVIAVLNEHEDHCGGDGDPDHPEGWDLAMAIEAVKDVREGLREAHATATDRKAGS